MNGDGVMQALQTHVEAIAQQHRDATVVLGCADDCKRACATGALRACHGQALAERHMERQRERDTAAAAAAALQERQRRQEIAAQAAARAAERGPQRPQRLTASESGAGTIGYVSLLRFRHGSTRQVPPAVRLAMQRGPAPWLQDRGDGDGEAPTVPGECVECGMAGDDDDSGIADGGGGGGDDPHADDHNDEGSSYANDAVDGDVCRRVASDGSSQQVVEHVQAAGGDTDGRVEDLLAAAAGGTAVVYDEQPPPACKRPGRRPTAWRGRRSPASRMA